MNREEKILAALLVTLFVVCFSIVLLAPRHGECIRKQTVMMRTPDGMLMPIVVCVERSENQQ